MTIFQLAQHANIIASTCGLISNLHRVSLENDPVLNCLQLRQTLTDFQNFLTLGLDSDYVMN